MNPDYIYMEKTLVLNLVKHFFIPDGGDVAVCFIKSVKSHRTAFHEWLSLSLMTLSLLVLRGMYEFHLIAILGYESIWTLS